MSPGTWSKGSGGFAALAAALALWAGGGQALAFVPIGVQWSGGTVGFRINPSFPEVAISGSAAEQIELIRCGAAAWRAQTRANFEFQYLGTTTKKGLNDRDADHVISYVDEDGGDALAVTLIGGDGGVASTFDIVFYARTAGAMNHWSGPGEPASGQYDILGVATHELGHALGLDHTSVAGATMFPSATGRALAMRTLHPDDRTGVESLYGTSGRPGPAVSILAITPGSGPTAGGNELLIEGFNFTYPSETTVRLGGSVLPASQWTQEACSRIRIPSLPAHAAGAVDIEVSNSIGSGRVAGGYLYEGLKPGLTGVEPMTGPTAGGVPITVRGARFATGAIVRIGGVPLMNAVILDAETIVGLLPPSSVAGPVDVAVTLNGESSVLPGGFVYNPYSLRVEDITAAPGSQGVPLRLFVTSPDDLAGVSVALQHDPTALVVSEASIEGTPAAAAEFFGANIEASTGILTAGVVMALQGGGNVLSAGADIVFLRLKLDVSPATTSGTELLVQLRSGIGSPPILNLVTRSGETDGVEPTLLDGSVMVQDALFLRGDANGDGKRDISDPIAHLDFLFRGGAASPCEDAADTNDDGRLDLSDAVMGLSFLFQGKPTLPAPFPGAGVDPTPDALGCLSPLP